MGKQMQRMMEATSASLVMIRYISITCKTEDGNPEHTPIVRSEQ